jgi:hypothetical protein
MLFCYLDGIRSLCEAGEEGKEKRKIMHLLLKNNENEEAYN